MTWVVDTPARLIASTNGCRWVAPFFVWATKKDQWKNRGYFTLQGINISHLGKIIFKMPFLGDILVSWRVAVYIFFKHLFKASLDFPDQIQQLNWGRWSLGSWNFWTYPRPRPWSYRSSLFVENIYQCPLPLGCQLTNGVTYAMSIHVLQRWLVWYLEGKINSLRRPHSNVEGNRFDFFQIKRKTNKSHQLKNYTGVPVTLNNLGTVGTSFELFIKFQWLRNHNETDNPQEPTRKVLYLKDPSTPWSGCPKPLPGHSCLCTFNDPRRPWSKNTANLLQKTQQVQHLSINW